MSLRRFYTRIENEETIQVYFFILNDTPIEECPICYETKNIETLSCHQCEKGFHLDCIESWFQTNTDRTCPHCRAKWKFEIDITEKPRILPIHVELDQYTPMPSYRLDRNNHNHNNRRRNGLTVMGSISGSISADNIIYNLFWT